MTINLWAERFPIHLSTEELRARVERQGIKVTGLADLPSELAYKRLEGALKATFVLTANTESALRDLLGMAHAHAEIYYPTQEEFIRQLYLPKTREPYFARCLTGGAGTGKTQLFAAFARACIPKAIMPAIGGHGPFKIEPAKQICIEGMQGVGQILTSIARPEIATGRLKISNKKLFIDCADWLYLCGVCGLFADEMQFLTTSVGANVLVSKVILGLSYTRVPVVYAANYGLVHRLKKRPPEERQRILHKPILLQQDAVDSPCWRRVLEQYQNVLSDAIDFSLVDHHKDLWGYTVGIKRELTHLLLLSYQRARAGGKTTAKASWEDVLAAYRGRAFAESRLDIEIILGNNATLLAKRKDLCCPFPFEETEVSIEKAAAVEHRTAALTASTQDDVLTSTERKRRKELQSDGKVNNVRSIGSAKKTSARGLTVESLTKAAIDFQTSRGK